MSDSTESLPLGLALQQAARPIDSEQLELMGKRAAAAYSDHGTKLSDAVVEVVKEAKGLLKHFKWSRIWPILGIL